MSRRVEWLNANKYRKYPFTEDAIPVSGFGEDLSDAVILDFRVVNYVHVAVTLSLTGIELLTPTSGPRVANFVFTYSPAAAFQTLTLSVPENAAFPFESSLFEDGDVQSSTCVFGAGVEALFTYPDGTYAVSGLELEPALVGLQGNHRVTHIQALDPLGLEAKGIVSFFGSYNCDIQIDPDSNTVTILAGRGYGEGVSCQDDTAGLTTCKDICSRINGLAASDLGEVLLEAGAGVEVIADTGNNTLIIRATVDVEELKNCG